MSSSDTCNSNSKGRIWAKGRIIRNRPMCTGGIDEIIHADFKYTTTVHKSILIIYPAGIDPPFGLLTNKL